MSYMTVREVAEMLHVDEKTVSRWSRSDPSMPVLRRGKIVRFPREALMRWLDAQVPRAARKHTNSAPQGQLSASA